MPEASSAPPTCAWCGLPLDAAEHRGPRVAVCAACGAGTTVPPPTDAELATAYASWYRPPSGRFSGAGDRLLTSLRGTLARRLDRAAPQGAILDVGAGDGALLDALRARGRKAEGLERESTRADVRAGRLEDLDGDWAAIVFWHSLEHLRAPPGELAAAAARLRPGGLLVVATPNFASLQAEAFGAGWFALDVPRHLVHIPAPALLARLDELGLRVERVSYVRGGQLVFGWLQGLVARLPGRPDLYDAIRRPEARRRPLPRARRLTILAAATILAPIALTAAGIEAATRRGGTVYVEARRPTS